MAEIGRAIVLLGAGHSHLHVLSNWRPDRCAGVTLTCVSQFASAAYSGLLPGVLAGQFAPEAMRIDLPTLCRRAGAQLLVDAVQAVDVAGRCLVLAGGGIMRFDVLSLNVGSTPSTKGVAFAPGVAPIPIKPMQSFLERFGASLEAAAEKEPRRIIRVVIVGGGAGGVEIALCLRPFIDSVLGPGRVTERVLVAGGRLLAGHASTTIRRIARALDRAAVHVLQRRVTALEADCIRLDDGTARAADVVVWATNAAPAPILTTMDLPKDADGFLLTTDTLRSTADAHVFAVGDTGSMAGQPTAKAGVYAVRQGPVLLDNLKRVFTGRPLRRYVPQATFLRLLNTGDGRAVAEWRGLSFEGRWCWRLKKAIDERFVARNRFSD